jgi:hypothetical protein
MERKIVTNEDYKWVEEQFIIGMFLKFKIDKHEVLIGLLRDKKKMSLSYVVIVDNKVQTTEKNWVHIVERTKFSKKYINFYEKTFGKEYCKEKGMYEKYSYTLPLFPSFTALKRMLKKHNEVICLGENKYIGFTGGENEGN